MTASSQIDYNLIRQIVREEICRALNAPEPLRITADELCQRLRIGRRTLDRWVARRRIPYEKIGRVLRFDIQAVDASLAKFRRGG